MEATERGNRDGEQRTERGQRDGSPSERGWLEKRVLR